MKSEIKKLWVDALRSGNYQQCQSRLTDGKGYCCLGVLSQLYIDSEDNDCNAHWDKNNMFVYRYGNTLYYDGKLLPEPVREWAELDNNNPNIGTINHDNINTSEANDAWGFNFEQIAKFIKRNL